MFCFGVLAVMNKTKTEYRPIFKKLMRNKTKTKLIKKYLFTTTLYTFFVNRFGGIIGCVLVSRMIERGFFLGRIHPRSDQSQH